MLLVLLFLIGVLCILPAGFHFELFFRLLRWPWALGCCLRHRQNGTCGSSAKSILQSDKGASFLSAGQGRPPRRRRLWPEGQALSGTWTLGQHAVRTRHIHKVECWVLKGRGALSHCYQIWNAHIEESTGMEDAWCFVIRHKIEWYIFSPCSSM